MAPGAGTAQQPSQQPAGHVNVGANANLNANVNAQDPIQTLKDIGRTLAQLGISVEAAVNAGLLGGLSASDVRIVAEAHKEAALQLLTRPQAGSGDTNHTAAPAPVNHHQHYASSSVVGPDSSRASLYSQSFNANPATLSSGGSVGSAGSARFNPALVHPTTQTSGGASAPMPSSPAGSVGGVSVASAPALPVRQNTFATEDAEAEAEVDELSNIDTDCLDSLLQDEIEEKDDQRNYTVKKKNSIDEAAIAAKVETIKATSFDAGQYGFFGPPATSAQKGAESNKDEPEKAQHIEESGLLGALEGEAEEGDAQGESAENLGTKLSDLLQSKLKVEGGNGALPGGGNQPANEDAFGHYLAGLRLGTGF